MTMDANLRERLEDTRAILDELLVRLQAHDSLAGSLSDANRQLNQTAENTSDLVRSARATQAALTTALEKIQEVMDVLTRLDPAPVISGVESAESSIRASVTESFDQLKIILQEHATALQNAAADAQTTREHLDTVASRLSDTLQEQAAVLRETASSDARITREHLDSLVSALSAKHSRDTRFIKIVGTITLLASAAAAVISFIAIASP